MLKISNWNFLSFFSRRLSDSAPTTKQLQWQTQRRAQARQLAMNTSGGLHGPKIVQRHAEMRAYLLHCQRVLNARPVVDTGRMALGKSSASSSLTSSSVVDGIWDEKLVTANRIRARSVPANARRREMTVRSLKITIKMLYSNVSVPIALSGLINRRSCILFESWDFEEQFDRS